jgi:hypothetical protein
MGCVYFLTGNYDSRGGFMAEDYEDDAPDFITPEVITIPDTHKSYTYGSATTTASIDVFLVEDWLR